VNYQRKQNLRDRQYDFARPGAIYWFSSSGSTSEPVIYPWTERDQEIADSVVERAHRDLPALRPGVGVVIAPVGLPGMWHHMTRQLQHLGLAVLLPGVESPEKILDLIEEMRPSAIISLPLVLSRLGELNLRRGGSLLPEGAQVFTGGDVLSEARRAKIAALWGSTVTDFFGISEVFGPLATRDADSAKMRWHANEVHLEIHNENGQNIDPGETGVAVISTLWDRPALLERYWTGDCFQLIERSESDAPVFLMRGRSGMNDGLRPGAFVVDVDEALLSDSSVLTEWNVVGDLDNDPIVQVEAGGPLNGETIDGLSRIFSARPRIETVVPGTLERKALKLGLGLPR